MSNRRRNKRTKRKIVDTISNKNFVIISTILLVIIILCVGFNVFIHISETKKVEEEQLRIAKHVEDIYSSVEEDINSLNNYKAKYTICKLGKIDPQKGLGMTDANLTATLLKAKRIEHDDPFLYTYPKQVQKDKIPKEALEFFDDLIEHNDLRYKREAPCLDLKTIDFQIGEGGGHAFIKNGVYMYDNGEDTRSWI